MALLDLEGSFQLTRPGGARCKGRHPELPIVHTWFSVKESLKIEPQMESPPATENFLWPFS
jgi:hypothetical protein